MPKFKIRSLLKPLSSHRDSSKGPTQTIWCGPPIRENHPGYLKDRRSGDGPRNMMQFPKEAHKPLRSHRDNRGSNITSSDNTNVVQTGPTQTVWLGPPIQENHPGYLKERRSGDGPRRIMQFPMQFPMKKPYEKARKPWRRRIRSHRDNRRSDGTGSNKPSSIKIGSD